MAHSMTSGMLAVTRSEVCQPVFFAQVNTPTGNLNFWSGFGNFDWNGIVWLGAGDLYDIGAITEQNGVLAAGCALTLSGCNLATVSAALQDITRYQPSAIWIGAIDEDYELVNSPYQILNGRTDKCDIQATGKTATVTVAIESRLIAMRTPRWRRYTQLDQQIEHPQDAGFSFVDTLQDAVIAFGVSGGPSI